MSSSTTQDTKLLLNFLQKYKLEHLYDKLCKSRIDIEELCECDEAIIRQTAKYHLKLKSTDLSSFVTALVTHNSLQCLTKRNFEISSCIDSLEYSKNELSLKQSSDILYVNQKFKKLQKTLKKREQILIANLQKKSENKINLLNEQILSLNTYKTQLEQTYNTVITSKRHSNMENMSTNALLNESIRYNKDKFANMNKMSVEIPNFDDIISQIKRTGIIIDEFYDNSDPPFDNKIDDKLDCLCGTQLILTKVCKAYNTDKQKIYCNFCTNFCDFESGIYHCPRGDIQLHPGGFDLCYFCGSKCFEARKADKRRENEEKKRQIQADRHRQRRKKAMSNGLAEIGHTYRRRRPNAPPVVNRHQRSYSAHVQKSGEWEGGMYRKMYFGNGNTRNGNGNGNVVSNAYEFEYKGQLKQLTDMGYDSKKGKRLLIKHSGNLTKSLGELM